MAQVQKITPFLWFDHQAEEAAHFYTKIFKNSRVDMVSPMVTTFTLEGLQFMALNGGPHHQFNEAFSLFVSCTTQEEVDELWKKLIADGGEESQCGWLRDKFGLSWQIIPNTLMELMSDPDREKANRVMQAMLKMKKIEIADLKKAYRGE